MRRVPILVLSLAAVAATVALLLGPVGGLAQPNDGFLAYVVWVEARALQWHEQGHTDDPQMDQHTAFALLGLGAAGTGTGRSPQPNGIQNLIVFKSPNPVFRIVSVGKAGDVSRSVEMLVLKQAAGVGRPQVFSWKEL